MTDPTRPVPYERITILRESLVDGLTTTTVFDKASMVISQEEPPLPNLREDPLRVPATPPPPTVHIEIKPVRDELTGIWVHSHSSAAFVLPPEFERG